MAVLSEDDRDDGDKAALARDDDSDGDMAALSDGDGDDGDDMAVLNEGDDDGDMDVLGDECDDGDMAVLGGVYGRIATSCECMEECDCALRAFEAAEGDGDDWDGMAVLSGDEGDDVDDMALPRAADDILGSFSEGQA